MQTPCFAAAVVPVLSPKKLCYRHRREPKQLKPTLRRKVKVHAELDRHIISLQCGGGTSIKIPLATQELDMLKATVAQAVATFAEKAKAERPRRWESVECKFQGVIVENTGTGMKSPHHFKTKLVLACLRYSTSSHYLLFFCRRGLLARFHGVLLQSQRAYVCF
jgi:hypothetical protein